MPANAQDVLIGYARLFYAPVGTALPANTVVYGADWAGSWVYVGYTLEPLNMASGLDVFNVEVQQSQVPIKQSIVNQTITLQTVLAQVSASLLHLIFGGTVTTTASSDILVAGLRSDPDVYAVGFEGLYKDASNNQRPVRWLFHRGSFTQNGDINWDKGAATGIPIAVEVLADTTRAAGAELFEFRKLLS